MKNILKSIIIFIFLMANLLVAQGRFTFNSLASMSEKRYGFGYTADDKYIYAVCGGIAAPPYYSNEVERYDPKNDTWTVVAKNLVRRRYCNAEYIPAQNKIYIMNGEYFTPSFNTISKRIEVLDLKNNILIENAENPNPVKNAGSAVWNNKIYIFGGQNIYGHTNDFYEYDPSNDTWKKLPDIPERIQTSGKIVDGILYIFGGYNTSRSFESVYAYNFKDSTWTRLEDLPFYLSANAVASDGRNIWLVGSYLDTYLLAAYDTKTKTLSKFDSNMINRRNSGAQIVGESLYVFGGNQNERVLSALSNTEFTDISNQKK